MLSLRIASQARSAESGWSVLGAAAIEAAVAEVPDSWLELDTDFSELADVRSAYVARIEARLAARSTWVPALQESARQAGARL